MNDNYFSFYTEDGTEVKATVLFTHHSEEFNKDYVVFIPEDTGEYSAAVYVMNEDGGSLEQIETQEEWDMLSEKLSQFIEAARAEAEGCGCCGGGCGGCEGGCDGECDGECECDCDGEGCCGQ